MFLILCLDGTGGRLIDDFIIGCVPLYSLSKFIGNFDKREKLFEKFQHSFILHLLQTFYRQSQKFAGYLFFFTQQFRSRGLSLQGISILHELAMSPSRSLQMELESKNIEDYKTKVN